MADGIRFLARLPDEFPSSPCLIGNGINRGATVEREAKMAIVFRRLRMAHPSRHEYKDKGRLASWLGHPHNALASSQALVHHSHATVCAVEV
jgi:hypothetical protein